MIEEKEQELKRTVHLDVEHANGTNYDLVAMLDPYGGVLVAWPVMGWLYRYFPRKKGYAPNEGFMQSEIKQLGRGPKNKYDRSAIKEIMDDWFEGRC